MLKNSNWLLTSNDGTNVTAVNGSRSWSGTLAAFEALKQLGDPEIVNGAPVFKSAAHMDFLSEYPGQQFQANIQQAAMLLPATEFGLGVAQVGEKIYNSNGEYWRTNDIPFTARPTYITIGDSILGLRSSTMTVTNLTCSNGVATFTATAHGAVTNTKISLQNVAEPSLNGLKKITVIDANTISFPCDKALSGIQTPINNTFVCYQQHRFTDVDIIGLFNAMLGAPLINLGNFAVGGDDTREMLEHIGDWSGLHPDYVFCCTGVNNCVADTITLEQSKADIIDIYHYVLSTGSRLIMLTPLTISNTFSAWTASRAAKLQQLIAWMLNYFANKPGIMIWDAHTPIVSYTSSTGNYRGGFTTDLIHPAKPAVYALAKRFVDKYSNVFPKYLQKVPSLAATYGTNSANKQLNDNPGFVRTTGGNVTGIATGQVADGYEVTVSGSPTSVTCSMEADVDGDGQKQVVTVVANGATQGFRLRRLAQFASRVAVGDIVVLEVRVEGTTIDSTFRWLQVGLDVTISGLSTTLNCVSSGGNDSWGNTFDTVWRTNEFEIPEGLTSLNIYIGGFHNAAGTSVLKISKCSIEKL